MKRILFCLLLLAVSGALLAAAPGASQTVASLTGPQITPQTAPQAKPAAPLPAKPAAARPATKPAVKKVRTETIVPGPKDIRERWAIRVFLAFLWLAIASLILVLRWKIQESDRVYHAKFYAHKDRTGETGSRPSAGSGIPAGPTAL